MYFWNTNGLAAALRAGRIGASEQAKYLLANLLMFELGSLAASCMPRMSPGSALLEGCVSMGALVIGLLACSAINRRGDDADFVSRFICLSWPLAIRFIVLAIPVALVTGGVLAGLTPANCVDRQAMVNGAGLGILALGSAMYYWRLARWMAVVSGAATRPTPSGISVQTT